MRALLSAVGTRGDVQPLLALAEAVRARGHEVRVCVPPNFVAWAQQRGFTAYAVGVEMRPPPSAAPLTAEALAKLRASMPDLVTEQFSSVGAAMRDGCDVVLGANAHQYAARSLAELARIPYVTAVYAPVVIPSSEHTSPGGSSADWNARALTRVNENRVRLGLGPIDDVLRFNLTERPWLACDPLLGPAPGDVPTFTTGAWVFNDETPLPAAITEFLAAGPAPLFLGFGSMPAREGTAAMLVEAVRALGARAIISRGWAGLALEAERDILVVDEVNHGALFPHVAAVVHHGGAGTTFSAARAGVPQVIAPMFSDQFYWGSRVKALGLGSTIDGALSVEALTVAVQHARGCAEQARTVASRLALDGAEVAAQALEALVT